MRSLANAADVLDGGPDGEPFEGSEGESAAGAAARSSRPAHVIFIGGSSGG